MAIRIKFDPSYNVCPPTFILATRKGRKLGSVPARDIALSDNLNSYSEVSFKVNKEEDGVPYNLWHKLTDFKLLWCKEWDIWFEIRVEINEENKLVKNVLAKSLGECELSQINLYDIEINTENDIARDDYEPTILFDEKNPGSSLLNRITEKAPHYRIKHVDASIAKIQRTFSFNNKSIYDALQEIATEINCLFIIGSGSDVDGKIERAISAFDLEAYCLECGYRGEYVDVCPECGSDDLLSGYGNDTTILISSDNISNAITYSTNVDSVKNCFKLVAGDDLMTATITNCNPNGSGYIWYVSESTKEDMSEELVSALNEYDTQYNYYQNEHVVSFDNTLVRNYNNLIDKYAEYSKDLEKLPTSIVGYPALMNAYYDTIDFELFLSNSLMPSADLLDTTAKSEAAKITAANMSPVAVQNLETCSVTTASSAALAMAKVIVDPRYQVKLDSSSFDGIRWTGNFIVTNYSDEEDTATSKEIIIEISDNYEEFVKQKLEKALNKDSDEAVDITSLFALDLSVFSNELKKYSLSRLSSFYNSCQSCLDILIEQGIANKGEWEDKDPNLYEQIYLEYYNKSKAISEEISVRESEISIVVGLYDSDGDLLSDGMQSVILEERNLIQSILDFQAFLGDELWLEFAAYRREDTYQNDNYISDGLNNVELFERANEFINTAKKDIFKSSTLQHSISATLKNLLVMKEFAPIVDYFEVGNWIRVKIDNQLYRLRLLSYGIDYNDIVNLTVTFSDVQTAANGMTDAESILNQAVSMASSYDSVARQASQGKKSSKQLDDWVTKGLALTKMKIVDSADNQNIVWDSHGLLCKEYLPITDTYDDKQLKLINRGIYLTDDNWLTSRTGVGDFTFYNPETGQMEESYGVIADTLVGNLILSEKVGIYNKSNSITLDQNGVVITTDNTGSEANQTAFAIRKKSLDTDGNEYLIQILYVDSDGDLVLNGSIRINSTTDTEISTLDDLTDPSRFSEEIKETIYNELNRPADESIEGDTGGVYSTINIKYQEVYEYSEKMLNDYKASVGQYMQFDDNGLTLGSSSSSFKTVIDNERLAFKEGDAVIAYISNSQLYITDAIIKNSLILGSFFFSPRDDGGVSLTWQGE